MSIAQTNEIEIVEQFRAAMHAKDIVTDDEIIADGRIHRVHVDGDRKGSRNGWYILFSNGRASGAFGCARRYGIDAKFTWSADKSTQKLTPAERRAYRERIEHQKREREAEENARREAAATLAERIWNSAKPAEKPSDVTHPYLRSKGVGANGARVGDWPIIDANTGEIRYTVKGALILQIRDFDKRVHSVQAIIERVGEDGRREFTKLFLRDGAKRGYFFPIGQPVKGADGRRTFIVAEGFATAASVHEATGHGCVVSFDANNLAPVCREIRARFPDARILVVGDRDAEEHAQSTGSRKAAEAALEVGASLFIPEWVAGGCDANDIYVRGFQHEWTDIDGNLQTVDIPGPDHLQGCIELALAAGPLDAEGFKGMMEGIVCAAGQSVDAAPVTAEQAGAGQSAAAADSIEAGFTVLGGARDAKTIYVFSHSSRQVMDLRAGSIREGDLLALLPDVNWWELQFPKSKGGIDVRQAIAFLAQRAHARGVFNPDVKRGRGGWTDAGRTVLHLGDRLIVDGVETPLTKIESRFIYPECLALPSQSDAPLSDDEARRILDVSSRFRWKRPASAALLAGWIALAPLCGALRWRPHVWVTGGPGSGKTSLMTQFVHELVNGGPDGHAGWAQFLNGNSTESGVRQDLRDDALPVLFDEFEGGEDQDARRVQNMLALARQSSSNTAARTLKGSPGGEALAFRTRSMFAFSSIGVSLKHQADVERVSVLDLRPKRDGFEAGAWERLVDDLAALRREGFAGRLLRRAIDLLPVTLKNIATFSAVAANRFGSQRDGDQYGTLLAGAWSLHSSAEVSAEQARQWIDSFVWDDFVDEDEGRASVIDAMFGKAVRLSSGEQVLFGALVRRADHREVAGVHVTPEAASAVLALYGVKVSGGWMYVSNKVTAARAELLKGSYFASPDTLRRALRELPGADNNENRAVHFAGIGTDKCSRVLLRSTLNDDEAPINSEEF